MKIAMIGTGYVGLVSGVCFSYFGNEEVCYDKDTAKIEKLYRGEIPMIEPRRDVLLARNVKAGRLTFTLDIKAAVSGADAVFIDLGAAERRCEDPADNSAGIARAAARGADLTGA
ncbi:MAG: UDP-glucose 6-dehydrogenase, partial [Cereibacter sp.]